MSQPTVVINRGPHQISDSAANIHPGHWNGDVRRWRPQDSDLPPLLKIMSQMGKTPTDSVTFHTFEKPFNIWGGACPTVNAACVHTAVSLNAAYASGGVYGTNLYVALLAEDAQMLLKDDVIQLYEAASAARLQCLVLSVNVAGDATSYANVMLLETDTGNKLAITGLRWSLVSRAESEIAELPISISEQPTDFYNYTQQIMASAEISLRAVNELSRITASQKDEKAKDAFDRFNIIRERNMMFGVRLSLAGGKTMSGGIRWWLSQRASGNIVDWRTDTTYSTSGQSFENGAMGFFRGLSEVASRYSRPGSKKVMLTSGTVINSISAAVQSLAHTHYELGKQEVNGYGLTVRNLYGLNQNWELVQSPLFDIDPTYRYAAAVIEPERLKLLTKNGGEKRFIPWSAIKSMDGQNFITGIKCGWYVDEGLDMSVPDAHMWLEGIGLAKTV